MRHPVLLAALALGVVTSSLTAQSNRRPSPRRGETSISIDRQGTDRCRVVIDGRTLPDSEAQRYCSDRSFAFSMSPRFARGMEISFDSLRSDMKLFGGFDSLLTSRPILGVTVDTRPRDTDRYGAFIVAVTPSGPADKAGIQSGDILTRIVGRSLSSGATSRAVGADESRPYVRLIEAMSTVEAGKEITVDYRRGDANLSTKVTPRDSEGFFAVNFDESPMVDGRGPQFTLRNLISADSTARNFREVPGIPVRPFTAYSTGGLGFGSILGSTELATMNPKLGSYFGVSAGVLVIAADEKNALNLESGDVVRSIGGREVHSPSEMGRVLRSYVPGDSLSLEITRNKKSQTLTTRLP